MSTSQQRGFINIQSTELVMLQNELADMGSRALAFVIDFVIRGVVTAGIIYLYYVLNIFTYFDDRITFSLMLIPMGIFLSYHIFFDVF